MLDDHIHGIKRLLATSHPTEEVGSKRQDEPSHGLSNSR